MIQNMLILDVVMMTLLLVSILYCLVLNRKINRLHQSKQEFIAMVQQFDKAATQAGKHIAEIRTMADTIHQEIDQKSEHAKIIIDDLDYMSEKAKNIVTASKMTLNKLRESSNIASNYNHQTNASSQAMKKSPVEPSQRNNIIPIKKKQIAQDKTAIIQTLMERIAASQGSDNQEAIADIQKDIMRNLQTSQQD